MANATELEFADSGLRLTFSRDLAQKYTRYWNVWNVWNVKSDEAQQPPKPDSKTTWQVAGYYDFLQISEFRSLDALKRLSEDEERLVSWRSFSDLVLIPFEDATPDGAFVEMLLHPAPDAEAENPLLVVIELTLSPGVFEFDPGPQRVIQAIRDTARLLEEGRRNLAEAARQQAERVASDSKPIQPAPDFGFPMHTFATLSGPDLVVLAIAQDSRQLWGIHRLVSRARRMLLAEVAGREEIFDPKDPRIQKWPGHAFVSVEPVVTFSVNARERFETEEFRRAEKSSGLELRFSLRVDSGHEVKVIDDMRETLENDRNGLDWLSDKRLPVISWGNYAVSGFFSHFAQLVKVWDQRWFAASVENHWREEHLIDSTTAPSFKDNCQEHCPEHPVHADRVWQLTENVKETLDDIHDKLESFGKKFLNASQWAELRSIYVTLRSCFFRQGLLGTARDLLPFFWQLSRALSLDEEWEHYLGSPGMANPERDHHEIVERRGRFSMELQKLFAHAQRALRNRVEHRSLQADPPIPHTLAHGACKLINAYSTVFYLACELFRGMGPEREQPPGDVHRFAAAVCAGSCGQVECDELFADFREYIEAAGGGQGGTIPFPGRLLNQRSEVAGWSARLLLLDISGNSLLRPELCFVHCLHEMAELSEWIMLPGNVDIRSRLNKWLLQEIAWAFADALARAERERPEADVRARAQGLHELATKFVDYSGVVYGLGYFDLREWNTVQDMGLDLARRPHPEALVRGLPEAIEEAADELDRDKFKTGGPSRVKRFLAEEIRQSGIADIGRAVTSAARSPKFAESVSMIQGLAPEIVGDVGMWCALDHILGHGTIRAQAERRPDLHRVFKSLLRAAAESNTPAVALSRVNETVVHRWAVQAAAMTPDDRWKKEILHHVDCLQRELDDEKLGLHTIGLVEAEKSLDRCSEKGWQAQFDKGEDSGSLVGGLRGLDAYRGTEADQGRPKTTGPLFLAESTFGEADQELFKAFRAAWRSPNEGGNGWPVLSSGSLRFVFKLWGAAARFAVKQMLDRVAK